MSQGEARHSSSRGRAPSTCKHRHRCGSTGSFDIQLLDTGLGNADTQQGEKQMSA